MRASDIGPDAFEPNNVVAVPDADDVCFLPEVVDVPVRPPGRAEMMPETSFESARTERAANVQVVRRFEANSAEAPDPNLRWRLQLQ